MAFEEDPIKGLLFGLGFALAVSALIEVVRYVRRRRQTEDDVPSEHRELAGADR
jgi:membrane-associated protein